MRIMKKFFGVIVAVCIIALSVPQINFATENKDEMDLEASESYYYPKDQGSINYVDDDMLPVSGNPYVDVNESDWYYNSVMYARDEGYMTGVDPTHFDPGAYLQRQDFALALMRHYISKGGTVTQQDDGTYYGKAVAWAKARGIMTGYTNGDFGVGDVLTRQDCVVTLFRYMFDCGLVMLDPFENPDYAAKKQEFESTYVDVDQLRDYSYEYMFESVMNSNLITGVERDGVKYLDPNGLTTRGTASVMTERWFTHFNGLFEQIK